MTSVTASKTTPEGSPRNSSSLDGDLPLYEEFQYSDHHHDALPSTTATPAEVAHFLLHLLLSTEAMSLDQGRRAVAKWTKGTRQQLLNYPPVMYFEIFGRRVDCVSRSEDGGPLREEQRILVQA